MVTFCVKLVLHNSGLIDFAGALDVQASSLDVTQSGRIAAGGALSTAGSSMRKDR